MGPNVDSERAKLAKMRENAQTSKAARKKKAKVRWRFMLDLFRLLNSSIKKLETKVKLKTNEIKLKTNGLAQAWIDVVAAREATKALKDDLKELNDTNVV
ncbi:unnamed protein product [Ilex paraguariensis]|uniref:Uncharacterized protein n=1 Tax=Ilex paraguariensis TaxID=185542 RepID=A0ABC8RM10_9AQUA